MTRSIVGRPAWLTLLGLVAAGVPIGCGRAGGDHQTRPLSRAYDAGTESTERDAGPVPDATPTDVEAGTDDAGAGDVGPLGDGGVSCIDGGAGPKGTRLVESSTAEVVGLTDDDQVIFVESSTNMLSAVPAVGGAVMSIAQTQGSVRVASKAVFDWTAQNQDGTVGTLQVWTLAAGSHSLASASLTGVADSSEDGTKVLYFDNANASVADLYVATVDGSSKTKLATGISWTQSCLPQVSFIGSSAVLGYCPTVPTAGGNPVGTLALYIGASGASVALSTQAVLSFQSAGTLILYDDPRGLTVADTTTGRATVIDSSGGTSAAFAHDGQSVVYLATDGAIRRSPVSSPSPTMLLSPGFDGVSSLSPDDRWLLASKHHDPTTGRSDIYLASATAAGSPEAILASATGTFYGSPFTADSSRVLYIDNASTGAGDYNFALTTGGLGTKIASRVWVGYATTGTKVVYQSGFVPSVGLNGQGTADIEWVDVSDVPPTPVLLVNQSDPGLFLTSARNRIVYALTSCAVGSAGIWVMPTP